MTIIFRMLFGKWAQGEMNWHGNEYRRNLIIKREQKWIPITLVIDIILIIIYCN